MPEPIRALIYLSPGQLTLEQAGARCATYCEAHGYRIVGLVVDDQTARHWGDTVIAMLANGDADVVVVNDPRDLPPHRRPRLEAVVDQEPRPLDHRPLRRRVRPRALDR